MYFLNQHKGKVRASTWRCLRFQLEPKTKGRADARVRAGGGLGGNPNRSLQPRPAPSCRPCPLGMAATWQLAGRLLVGKEQRRTVRQRGPPDETAGESQQGKRGAGSPRLSSHCWTDPRKVSPCHSLQGLERAKERGGGNAGQLALTGLLGLHLYTKLHPKASAPRVMCGHTRISQRGCQPGRPAETQDTQ